MKLSEREFDANFNVQDTAEKNMIIPLLSDKRFKNFINLVKKKVWQENRDTFADVYVDETLRLTTFPSET